MADEEDIAALVIDNGSGMCKGEFRLVVFWRKENVRRDCRPRLIESYVRGST